MNFYNVFSKKITSILLLAFVGAFFFTQQVFAVKSIDDVRPDKSLTIISGDSSKASEVYITSKEISDTKIELDGHIMRKSNQMILMIYGANDSTNISLDPNKRINPDGNKGTFPDNIANFVNYNIISLDDPTKPYLFERKIIVENLEPGKMYYIQIKDMVSGAIYEPISFTTTNTGGAISPPEQSTPISTADQKKAIKVTVFNPDISLNSSGKYSVTFRGTITTDNNATIPSVGLKLLIGESVSNLKDENRIVFGPKSLSPGIIENISWVMSDFSPGGTYYYRFVDTDSSRGFSTGSYPFTIPSGTTTTVPTGPVTTTPPPTAYNPEQDTGLLIANYQLPTNIGEPGNASGGVVTESTNPLVPCGKRSDTGEDIYCSFGHLIIMVGRVIDFMLVLLIPLVVLICIYTGVQMILHRSMPAELTKYKENFKKIGIGILVMLLAWTIVATVLKTLLGPDASNFILLDIL